LALHERPVIIDDDTVGNPDGCFPGEHTGSKNRPSHGKRNQLLHFEFLQV